MGMFRTNDAAHTILRMRSGVFLVEKSTLGMKLAIDGAVMVEAEGSWELMYGACGVAVLPEVGYLAGGREIGGVSSGSILVLGEKRPMRTIL